MDKQTLTTTCGLDCFNCPSYEGNITEEYKKRTSEFLKIPIEDTLYESVRPVQNEAHRIRWMD